MKIMEMAIDDIVVLKSYRQDMGDIPALAANIEKIGLLQAIGITPGNHLIFGSRRIAAHRHLGRTTISARIIEIDDIIRGTWSENEMRKAFTRSERVAILATMERKHPGQPKKNCQNSDNTFSGESRDQYTIRAGLGNHTTAYEAKKVIEDAIPEVIAAMDREEISIHAGFTISQVEPDEQAKIIRLPTKQRREAVNEIRSRKREKSSETKDRKKTKSRSRRLEREAVIPTYWPNMTLEEQGFPPRETWGEPDEDRPGLTKHQGHIAKHGHVHTMPQSQRQAQDNRIAAQRLNGQTRDLDKAVAAFLDDNPMDLDNFLGTLEDMSPSEAARVITRLENLPARLERLNRAHVYVMRLVDLMRSRASDQTEKRSA